MYYDAQERAVIEDSNISNADHDTNGSQISTDLSENDIKEAPTIDQSFKSIQSPLPSNSPEDFSKANNLETPQIQNNVQDQYGEKISSLEEKQHLEKTTGKKSNSANNGTSSKEITS